MKDLEVIQVIHTKLATRGRGTEADPSRFLEQYWGMDGTLILDYDPHLGEIRFINGGIFRQVRALDEFEKV